MEVQQDVQFPLCGLWGQWAAGSQASSRALTQAGAMPEAWLRLSALASRYGSAASWQAALCNGE